MLKVLREIDLSNILGALAAAVAAVFFSGLHDNATQTAQIADAKDCRNQLIEARNRENACRDRAHDRDIDDLRQRLQKRG